MGRAQSLGDELVFFPQAISATVGRVVEVGALSKFVRWSRMRGSINRRTKEHQTRALRG